MITMHWFELMMLGCMLVLIGIVIGTKTSAHRWIEYQEWMEKNK